MNFVDYHDGYQMLELIHKHLSKQSKTIIFVYCFVFMLFIGLLEYATGREIIISFFFLIPIIIVTWYAGTKYGYIISLASSIIWFLTDYYNYPVYSVWFIPYWNASVRFAFDVVIVFLLHKINEALVNEEKLSRIDALTGLANSRSFKEIAKIELARSERHQIPFTIAYLDLDNFKSVNDTHGHHVGDLLLKEVANVMTSSLRQIDRVARLGGDEFIILMPETDAIEGKQAISKIRDALVNKMNDKNWPVTASIGVITFEMTPVSTYEMIKMVDSLMYSVKNAGKNDIAYNTFNKRSNTIVN